MLAFFAVGVLNGSDRYALFFDLFLGLSRK